MDTPTVILSFDVEEHDRIEAAAGLSVTPTMKATYAQRMEHTTQVLLERLATRKVLATFYVVGEIAKTHPALVKAMVAAGHEVASHSWDHQRVNRLTPQTFLDDARKSRLILEDVTGTPVFGYRAPTFSIMHETAWALDALVEAGYQYDSSIFPVRHDRYGIPSAPRVPFWAKGPHNRILEIPPTTWRTLGQNLPVAGGGYFRLFPLFMMKKGIRQLSRITPPAPAMLYFHPWEFDTQQPKLPLKTVSKWRTYVGVGRSLARLDRLMQMKPCRFVRAIDVVQELKQQPELLPEFQVGNPGVMVQTGKVTSGKPELSPR